MSAGSALRAAGEFEPLSKQIVWTGQFPEVDYYAPAERDVATVCATFGCDSLDMTG